MEKMNKAQAISEFRECVGRSYDHDIIAKQQAWLAFIDSLHRDGLVTDKQVNNWTNPF